MHKKKLLVLMLVIIFLSLIAAACANKSLVEQKDETVFAQRKAITIGVPVPLEFAEANTAFLEGVRLAQEEINDSGIMGKNIELLITDDHGIFKDAVDIAQNFASNTKLVAIIGHWFSGIAIPVSSIYEKAGILTVVPTVSNPDLTDKGFKFVFQNIPSDKEIAAQMCKYALEKDYDSIVVYHEDSSYGENLADAFEKAAKLAGLTIADRTSGLTNELSLKRAHAKWQALDFQAVFFALNMPEGASVIKNFRKIDEQTPILAGDGLDVANLRETLGEDAEGMVIATLYNPFEERPELVKFVTRYKEKYNQEPDVWAIQGYDSLKLLAHVIAKTGSTSPTILAEEIRSMEAWNSVLGSITFNPDGEVLGRKIYKKKVVQGQFQYLD